MNKSQSQPDSTSRKARNRPPLINQATGETVDIPIEGNLGLLALGYVGLMAWRDARRHAVPETPLSQPDK